MRCAASLREALASKARSPRRLSALYSRLGDSVRSLSGLEPTLAFAVVGQARNDGQITPEREGDLLASLLRHWAWRSTVVASEVCSHVGPDPDPNGELAKFSAQAVR